MIEVSTDLDRLKKRFRLCKNDFPDLELDKLDSFIQLHGIITNYLKKP